ncbi:MAG: enterochelin esterase-like enzyme [Candidatus Azotimanducaceae bacterium]|jgi:enterochelin esterase-like enzyme
MPKHNFNLLSGRIENVVLESAAIQNNILGDPRERQIAVYLPEGYDSANKNYPLLVDIAGFTGSGLSHIAWKGFGETVPQRVERLLAENKMGEVVIAFPDCFTSLGGNQYINSSVMGNWADFLTKEMLPYLESNFRVIPGKGGRGLFGKSSGGYGAMVHGMLYGDDWGVIACHSGDMAFDLAYLSDFPKTLQHLARYGGEVTPFIRKMEKSRKVNGNDLHTLMILAMAATYDPAPEMPFGIQLPVDPHTCELDETMWARWLAWDPVQLVERADVVDSLRSLKGIYIDCGSDDQYSLVYGARQLTKKLEDNKIEFTFEEFPDNHSSVDYRMDISLPYMYKKIMGE